MKKLINLCLFFITLTILASCGAGDEGTASGGLSGGGGGSSSSGNSSDSGSSGGGSSLSSITISGIAQLGPIEGATVRAIQVDEYGDYAKDGDEIIYCSNEHISEEDGSFDVTLYETCVGKDIVLENRGGTYKDEATQEVVTLTDDDTLKTLVPEATKENMDLLNNSGGIGITPLSEIALERIKDTIQKGMKLKDVKSIVVDEMTEAFDVDPFTPPVPPNADISGSSKDDKRVKMMAVIAGFSEAANATCGSECNQMHFIKMQVLDYKDGKIDGKLGSNNIDDLGERKFTEIGIPSNVIQKVKQEFKETRQAIEAATTFEEKTEKSLMGKIKKGINDYSEIHNPDLVLFDVIMAHEAQENSVNDAFQNDKRFTGKYFKERDKHHSDYSHSRDPRSDHYNPVNDFNLLGDMYDPELDPCNPNKTGYNSADDPCLKIESIADKVDMGMNLTIQEVQELEEVTDDLQKETEDLFPNFKAMLHENQDLADEFDDNEFLQSDFVVNKFNEIDQQVNKIGGYDGYRGLAKEGFNLSEIMERESQSSSLDGLWFSKECTSQIEIINGDEVRLFYKENVKIDFGMIRIEKHFFKDPQCRLPSPLLSPNFSTGSLEVDIPSEGSLTFKGKDRIWVCVDEQTLVVDSSKPEAPEGECNSGSFSYKFLRNEEGEPEVIPYSLTGDILVVTLQDGDHEFTKDPRQDIFAYDEEEEAEKYIEQNEELRESMEMDQMLEGVVKPQYVQTKMFFFDASGSGHNYNGKFKQVITQFKDKKCNVIGGKKVIFGTYHTGRDLKDGDLFVDLVDRIDHSDPEKPQKIEDPFYTKITIYTDVDPDEAILGYQINRDRGKSKDKRADHIDTSRGENILRRANLTTRISADDSGTDFTSVNAAANNDPGNLSGAWRSKCAKSMKSARNFAEEKKRKIREEGSIEISIAPDDLANDEEFRKEFQDHIKDDFKDEHKEKFYNEGGSGGGDQHSQDDNQNQGQDHNQNHDQDHNQDRHNRHESEIDFSNEDNYLAKGDGSGTYTSGKILYNNPSLDQTATAASFEGVWVGNCENNNVGILSIFHPSDLPAGRGEVRFVCGGEVQEGKYKIQEIDSTSYFKFDAKFDYSEIHQTLAKLSDGRISFARGDCFDNGCFRPGKESIFVGATDGSGQFIGDAFYPIENQADTSFAASSPGQQWISSCVCRNSECKDYEKVTVSFSDEEEFSFKKKIYSDSACTTENALQEDDSEATGTWFSIPDFFIDHGQTEYQVTSNLFLTSNLELGPEGSCIHDWEEDLYFCEVGTLALINGELFLDTSEHDEADYYKEVYTEEIVHQFIEDYEDWAPKLGQDWFIRDGVSKDNIAKFSPSNLSSYNFNALPNKYFGPCEYGEGVYEFSLSGINPTSGSLKVTCDGEVTTATNVVVDTTTDTNTISIKGGSGTTVSHQKAGDTWDGDPNSIYLNLSLDTNSKIIMNHAKLDYLIPVANVDTNLGTPLIEGSYLSSCMLDFSRGKFFREKLTISSASITATINANISFSKNLYYDQDCDAYESVDFQLSDVSAEITYGADKVILDLSGTHTQQIGPKADECIGTGPYTCHLGKFVMHENALIPTMNVYDQYHADKKYDDNYYDQIEKDLEEIEKDLEELEKLFEEIDQTNEDIDKLFEELDQLQMQAPQKELLLRPGLTPEMFMSHIPAPSSLVTLSEFSGTYAGHCESGIGIYNFDFSEEDVAIEINCEGNIANMGTNEIISDTPDSTVFNVSAGPSNLRLSFDPTTSTIKLVDHQEVLLPIVSFEDYDDNLIPLVEGTFNGPCNFEPDVGKFVVFKVLVTNATVSSSDVTSKISIERKVFKDHHCQDFDSNEDPMRGIDAKFKYVDDSNGFLADLYIDFDSSAPHGECSESGNGSFTCYKNGEQWADNCEDVGDQIFSCNVDTLFLSKGGLLPVPKGHNEHGGPNNGPQGPPQGGPNYDPQGPPQGGPNNDPQGPPQGGPQ